MYINNVLREGLLGYASFLPLAYNISDIMMLVGDKEGRK
jgi:hypothetical protein